LPSSCRYCYTARMLPMPRRRPAGSSSPALLFSGQSVSSSSTWACHVGSFHSISECPRSLPPTLPCFMHTELSGPVELQPSKLVHQLEMSSVKSDRKHSQRAKNG